MPQVMPKSKLFFILKQLREYLQEVYGERLFKTILFGSQARDEATIDSDIDILIVLKGEVSAEQEIERTGGFIANLCLEYEQVIGSFFMNEEEFMTRNSPLMINIRREGITF